MIESLERRRLLIASLPDPTFGQGAFASADFFQSDDRGRGFAFDSAGSMVVVGSARTASAGEVIAVTRFTAAGDLDTSFSGDGKFTLGADGEDENFSRGFSASIQDNGDILVGGHGHSSGFTLLRLKSHGALDTAFGDNGVAQIEDDGPLGYRQILCIEQLNNGKILVGGMVQQPDGVAANEPFIAVGRYNANGTLDTSFGDNGTVITSLHFAQDGEPMALQADGKILLSGLSADGKGAIVRVTAAGDIDTAWGNSGVVILDDVGGITRGIYSIRVRDDGKIFGVGWADTSISDSAIRVVSLNADGSLDSGFSGDGTAIIDTDDLDSAQYLALDDDNRLLVGGATGGHSAVFVLTTDGMLDASFGNGGIVSLSRGSESGMIRVQNGKIHSLITPEFGFNQSNEMTIMRLGNDRVTISDGELGLLGDAGPNELELYPEGLQAALHYDGTSGEISIADITSILFDGGGGNDRLGINGVDTGSRTIPVIFLGGDGDDNLNAYVSSFLPVTMSGGAGHDAMGTGGDPLNTLLEGGDGDDTIFGSENADTLRGNAGRDIIFGMGGRDLIAGNGGKDRINGGQGSDRIYGGDNNDQLDGGPGNDRIHGQAGDDKLSGGKGADRLDGGIGSDLLIANAGNDTLFAGDGVFDRVDGGSGDDSAEVDAIDSLSSIQVVL